MAVLAALMQQGTTNPDSHRDLKTTQSTSTGARELHCVMTMVPRDLGEASREGPEQSQAKIVFS